MADEVVSLAINVDSTGTTAANAALNTLASTAESTGAQIDALTKSILDQQNAFNKVKAPVITPPAPIPSGVLTAQEKFLASLKAQAEAAGKSKAELLSLQAAQLGVSGSAAGYIADIQKASEATHEFGFNTARSKAELVVLAHELLQGNFKRFGASLLVLAEQTGASAVLFSGLGLAALGAVGSIAAFGYAVLKGAHDQQELQNALLLTNNYAHLTEDGFNALAKSISTSVSGATIGGAKETLLGLVASGRLTGDALASAGRASEAFQKATGESAEKSNKFFVDAVKDVSDFANKTNEQYHYLSAAQQEQVRNLQAQGQEQKALTIVFDAFADRLAPAAANIGSIAKAWNSAKEALSGYLDRLGSVGKNPTVDTELTKAEARLAQIKKQREGGSSGFGLDLTSTSESSDEALKAAQGDVDALKSSIALRKQVGDAQDANNRKQEAQHKLDELHEQYLGRAKEKEEAIGLARARALQADPTGKDPKVQKELNEVLAGINEKFKDRGALKPDATLKIDVDKIKADYKAVVDAQKGAEAEFQALNAAGLIDAKDYYTQLHDFAVQSATSQIDELAKIIAANQRFLNSKKGTAQENLTAQKDIDVATTQQIEVQNRLLSQVRVLDTQTRAYLVSVAEGYLKARQAAQLYLDQQDRAQQQTLSSLGKGDQDASRDAARSQITNRYGDAQRALDDEANRLRASGKFTNSEKERYDVESAQIKEFQEKALISWNAYYDQLIARDKDWHDGATRALSNYVDNAGFTAKNSEKVFTNALGNMEDAIVTFATTGKLSFKSLIDSFVADIIRLTVQEQLIKPIAGYLNGAAGGSTSSSSSSGTGDFLAGLVSTVGSFFGAYGAEGSSYSSSTGGGISDSARDFRSQYVSGGRALGGTVSAGGLYDVNETGRPELLNMAGKQYLMMGSQGQGTITPAAPAAPVSRPIVQNLTQNFTGNTSKQTASQAAVEAARALKQSQRTA